MKNISFYPIHDFIDIPKPTKNYIPDWYKDMPRYTNNDKSINYVNGTKNLTFKGCVPFLDSLTCGYTVELFQDIVVKKDSLGISQINWGVNPSPLEERIASVNNLLPTPHGYLKRHFAWHLPFSFKTPKGYSSLTCHPLNRYDLPFITLSAIIDSDGIIANGKVPFFIQENFEGVIPVGTPIMQIIPFKRENWKSEKDEDLKDASEKQHWLSNRTTKNNYKLRKWHKKEYL